MIGLNELINLNERAAAGQIVKRDNFNRESSFCESRSGFVVHSGVHRSTAFISREEHADSYHAANYWLRQEPAARDEFIVQIIGGASLEDAEERAFRAARPNWTVRKDGGAGKLKGGQEALTARTGSGRLSQSVGAFTWRHLHARTAG